MPVGNSAARRTGVWLVILLITGGMSLLTGCSGEKSIAALIQELKSANSDVRHAALKELELRGPEANEAIPFIAELLQDSVRDNRYRAAKVLSKIGADATTVPALAQALKDPDVEVRYYAAKSLSVVGPEAEGAVPDLIAALQDNKNEKLHGYLLKSLRKIGPKAQPAVPLLKELMVRHPNEAFRKEISAALASIERDGA